MDVELDQGEVIPDVALQCLDAAQAEGGELAVSSPTIEGDPMVTFYRVGPDIEGIEMFTDGSRDRFGTGDWSADECGPRSFIDGYGTCVETDGQGYAR